MKGTFNVCLIIKERESESERESKWFYTYLSSRFKKKEQRQGDSMF